MADFTPRDFLRTRNESALAEVAADLRFDASFLLLSGQNVIQLLKDCPAVWRTQITALGRDWLVDIGLPRRFPDESPIMYLHKWEDLFLRNPHVLRGGCLCAIPMSAALNNNDPVGLIRYMCHKAKDILDGTKSDDFREEFSYYWSRCTTENTRDVLVLDPIESLGKSFPVVFCKGFVCVASSIEIINHWISNRLGETTEFTGQGYGVAVNLDTPLLPKDYPSTYADLLTLAEKAGSSTAEMVQTHIFTMSSKGLALLIQKEAGGVALGGIIFDGLYSSDLAKGFRPGKVPMNILRARMASVLGSSGVERANVLRADSQWIHSRGGDGRDFSKKAVLLIGCGSLGGYVAHLLSRAGVGRLVITDNDQLRLENLGRHILGSSSLGRSKSEALAEQLMCELPHLQVTGIPQDWRDIVGTNETFFNEFDLILSTVADWRCEGPLNELTRRSPMPPVLFGWLEPYAVAGHCLAVCTKGGCFRCCVNEFGQVENPVAAFGGTTISREPGGCTHYQRYGTTALMPVASMISSIVLESLLFTPEDSYLNTWISAEEHLKSVGATLTTFWASRVGSESFSHTFRTPWYRSEQCPFCHSKKS